MVEVTNVSKNTEKNRFRKTSVVIPKGKSHHLSAQTERGKVRCFPL